MVVEKFHEIVDSMKTTIQKKDGIKSYHRARRLIDEAIKKFNLNLNGLVVLTEAASGNYIFTPLIAAVAGAKKVHAITKDSRYASTEQVIRNTLLLADYWGIRERLKIHTALTSNSIGMADIVTNLGFVRPINKGFISHMKKTAVIPLMFETWEYRRKDIDATECRQKGIAVLGTNERVPELDIFGYIGQLAMKLAFELDIEVNKSTVIVVGGGDFGENTANTFVNAGAQVVRFKMTEGDTPSNEKGKRGLGGCDLMVFVEHESNVLILGENGRLSIDDLLSINPGIAIVHIAGRVDHKAIKEARIPCCPAQLASPGQMSVGLDYLGPKPVIDLHTAGLKVGELMARPRLRGLSREKAEREALQHQLCQDFIYDHNQCIKCTWG